LGGVLDEFGGFFGVGVAVADQDILKIVKVAERVDPTSA
jgi:hypothetical protein